MVWLKKGVSMNYVHADEEVGQKGDKIEKFRKGESRGGDKTKRNCADVRGI